ncbi:hypothetical protein DYD83_11315 [Dickeya fangzhongdai]|uniref:Uncharacterized protein n=1 Tax=Dickeya fangzhongdai TaxID=1778540 RepID=A0A2K8QN72_9GAMM|nr:hypothetical protein CVE23_11265 [Dickeya fangzhongdai]QOH47943.1 hypothetical protein DYD82_11315 [Dickeya fangzhongdai]QOH52248.1 hypothetical protein DYD83_11315 [Dickeya fangzhongdai]GGB87771.1 hypothetical protein GCM10007171_00870 [Dickeya fangzhongdai]
MFEKQSIMYHSSQQGKTHEKTRVQSSAGCMRKMSTGITGDDALMLRLTGQAGMNTPDRCH